MRLFCIEGYGCCLRIGDNNCIFDLDFKCHSVNMKNVTEYKIFFLRKTLL